MVTTYGSFPGVRVDTSGGGITAVAIGAEEKLFVFGEASYQNDASFLNDGDEDPLESSLNGSTETAETINARREADTLFGSGTELADGMREALSNGANIDYLYGVAPKRYNAVSETQGSQTGTLDHTPVWEENVSDESNISALTVSDSSGTDPSVRYTYESPPSTGSIPSETIIVNPLTGEYAADASPSGDYEFDYKWLDWSSAFDASSVSNSINEDETAVFAVLSDSDTVSSDADGSATTYRQNYQFVNVVSGALPNTNEQINDSNNNYQRRDAQFDTSTFSQGSVDSDHYFKLAPTRLENVPKTIIGGVGGLFAGNPLNDPIYNDSLSGYDTLEQSFTKQDADNMRGENVIPVREGGSIRVKDNTSTSTSTDWERDFWRRRIADRVILLAKTIGDSIIGQINDSDTRTAARRLIESEMRDLVDDGLLKPNTSDTQNWFVDVYEDSSNVNEVNIDIGFTPYGVVKRVDAQITINA